ncbi:bloodthirsty-related gene family, member 12 [Paramormyrops kingsleyae]|uniref:Bloodthirsty-related gene family, member 12 n=1 Tax=Paramormyrops kingsleyae TaxID=1676925 RepID=A0A3B3QNS6_9TELE|nr:E3 ubiquitin-protein ligase TRIM39-like [Paramormyrops kingsleyae]
MQNLGSPAARTLSEEQFQCSICLEVFVEPVTTPCGHSFCKACLQGYWSHSRKFQCPMCKRSFTRRPELSVNCVLADITEQFQDTVTTNEAPRTLTRERDLGGSEGGSFAREGEVSCDDCIGRKMRAIRSCLNCQSSFCETHLRPHQRDRSLSSHRLVAPTLRLEQKVCRKHRRLLEAYCRSDHSCICTACADAAHKSHDVVSVDREWKRKMSHLNKRRSEFKHLIKERAKKLEEIKQSIKVIKSCAQKELEESWQVYADLLRLVEQSQAELVERIAAWQREAERKAQDLAEGLERELSQLRMRSTELDQLAQTQDQVLFLQSVPTMPPLLEPMDWSGVSVNTDLYVGTLRKSVSTLMDKVQEELNKLLEKELGKLQSYASEVLFDPSTAQRNLVVSEDGKQVKYEDHKQDVTEGHQRFHPALFLLGREGLASGQHYWEVKVGEKTAWMLGVARQSICRQGDVNLRPECGYWCMWLKNGEVKALSSTRLPLHLPTLPTKVGIYVDYEAGQVSFYDVKARLHLYTFMDTFTESLYPIFSPFPNRDGRNSAPLIISPIKHS